MQNNLKELWSIFDFTNPGRLGTLPLFQQQFSIPIKAGGYKNASPVQVHTAFRCATVLRSTILPFMIRRMKADVKANLPEKTEQILFCNLAPRQRAVYMDYIRRSEVREIVRAREMEDHSVRSRANGGLFKAISVLRKVCNHPDLLLDPYQRVSVVLLSYMFIQLIPIILFVHQLILQDATYGAISKSGKMIVLQQVLRIWNKEKHRVLLFSQGTQMLDILEAFVKAEGYSYARMDGTTPVRQRTGMISSFNAKNSKTFVFLLTTRVGGVGINLTGADRLILFDPDWNPATVSRLTLVKTYRFVNRICKRGSGLGDWAKLNR